MTQPVDRLQELLSRVQQNRGAPRDRSFAPPLSAAGAPARAAAPAPAPAPKVASVGAAPSAARPPSRGPVIEERVNLPQNRSVAARPGTAPVSRPQPAPSVSARDRAATPLELAVEDQINKTPSEPPTAQFTGNKAARPGAGFAPRAASRDPNDDSPDFTLEPEPIREANRPIAQVVSKHAPEIDATFGAMLKRSLSLRPR